MRWAWSSEPPASGSSRSRQATKWIRLSPASSAMAPSTWRPADGSGGSPVAAAGSTPASPGATDAPGRLVPRPTLRPAAACSILWHLGLDPRSRADALGTDGAGRAYPGASLWVGEATGAGGVGDGPSRSR